MERKPYFFRFDKSIKKNRFLVLFTKLLKIWKIDNIVAVIVRAALTIFPEFSLFHIMQEKFM
jgi:hypothetical protein